MQRRYGAVHLLKTHKVNISPNFMLQTTIILKKKLNRCVLHTRRCIVFTSIYMSKYKKVFF